MQILNKADLLKPAELQAAGAWLRARTAAAAILPASAAAVRGISAVQAWAVKQLPLGPTLYPKVVAPLPVPSSPLAAMTSLRLTAPERGRTRPLTV